MRYRSIQRIAAAASPALVAPRRLLWRGYARPSEHPACRAEWAREGKRDAIGDPLGVGSDLGSWVDAAGNYDLTVVGGTAPTGATSTGGPTVLSPNAAGCIGLAAGALPDDVAGTIGAVVRAPSVNLSARDFDSVVCFSETSSANKQLLCCMRRISMQFRFGFASQNTSGFSSWYGHTSLALNAWCRVIWTFSGSAMEIHVNGIAQSLTQDNSGSTSAGQWLSVVSDCNTVHLCGRQWSSGFAEFWANHFDSACWFHEAFAGADLLWLDEYLAARQAEVD